MGMAGSRFGRNVSLDRAFPETMPGLMQPDPHTISRTLMRRDTFTPATSLNLLAAAWIQFQTHDWFAHDRDAESGFEIPLPDGHGWHESPMRVPHTLGDHTRSDADGDLPPTYVNRLSHWWDASSIYGSSDEQRDRVRTFKDGKLVLKDGRLPLDTKTGTAITGFSENWWIGLGMLHTLFTLEHNAICDAVKKKHPEMSDDELFGTAQLVNAALIAKIHTVEWTPAIVAHPALKIGMRANWWGLLGERLHRLVGRIGSNEEVSGIPGSPTAQHGAPYQLTEEFVSVYRLHPLLPDELELHSLADNTLIDSMAFDEIILLNAEKVLASGVRSADLFYSFGIQHPGAVALHNYPRWMQDLTLPDGLRLDLGAVDIIRDRERGVPRYNEFRRQLHLTPAKTFADLTDNPVWAAELEQMYGDVERVDLQIGMHAETPPEGLRLQRHGVPGVHPDGVAADQERPVPHRLLHRGVLHEDRYEVARRQLDGHRAEAALPRARQGPRRRRQRVRAVEEEHGGQGHRAHQPRGRRVGARPAVLRSSSQRKAPMRSRKPLPPGRLGLPWLGETVAIARSNHGFYEDRFDKYGPIFKTRLFGVNFVVVSGAEAFHQFSTDPRIERGSTDPVSVEQIFLRSLALEDGEEHHMRKDVMLHGIRTREAINAYLERMQRRHDRHHRRLGRHRPRRRQARPPGAERAAEPLDLRQQRLPGACPRAQRAGRRHARRLPDGARVDPGDAVRQGDQGPRPRAGDHRPGDRRGTRRVEFDDMLSRMLAAAKDHMVPVDKLRGDLLHVFFASQGGYFVPLDADHARAGPAPRAAGTRAAAGAWRSRRTAR